MLAHRHFSQNRSRTGSLWSTTPSSNNSTPFWQFILICFLSLFMGLIPWFIGLIPAHQGGWGGWKADWQGGGRVAHWTHLTSEKEKSGWVLLCFAFLCKRSPSTLLCRLHRTVWGGRLCYSHVKTRLYLLNLLWSTIFFTRLSTVLERKKLWWTVAHFELKWIFAMNKFFWNKMQRSLGWPIVLV